MGEERTLAEMAAQAAGVDPWACPRCGCKGPHRVANTYDTADGRKRRRICRNCGQGLVRTTEVAVPSGFKVVVVPEEEASAYAA